jgi:hypothetical protein
MCIIQGQTESIAKTKILVAPLQDGKSQLTVYCNTVSLKTKGGAMILPFPQGDCDLVDLSAYATLFKDLNRLCWPVTKSRGFRGMTLSTNSLSDSLEVKQVGSYKASVVPGLEDFSRLRKDVFVVDPKVYEFLGTKYPEGYGFVVCQLDQNKEYHPFGYTHSKLPDGRMFVPTMHYHDHGSSDEKSNTMYRPPSWRHRAQTPPGEVAEWDHEIYTWNTPLGFVDPSFQQHQNLYPVERALHLEKLPPSLCRPAVIFGYKIQDYYQNHDLYCVA